MGFELECDKKGLESREYECEFAYVIVVIFNIIHGCNVFDGNFNLIEDGLEV